MSDIIMKDYDDLVCRNVYRTNKYKLALKTCFPEKFSIYSSLSPGYLRTCRLLIHNTKWGKFGLRKTGNRLFLPTT